MLGARPKVIDMLPPATAAAAARAVGLMWGCKSCRRPVVGSESHDCMFNPCNSLNGRESEAAHHADGWSTSMQAIKRADRPTN
jgi:hypothetical protein